MTRTDIYAIALWFLAIPANKYLGDYAAVACGVVGLAFLVVGRFHKDGIENYSILSLGLREDVLVSPAPDGEKPPDNVKCVAIRSASVQVENYAVFENQSGLFSFYALLRNDPLNPKPVYISELKAHIVVSNDQKEICSGYGAWLNRAENKVSLSSGGEAKLLLVVLDAEKAEVYALTNTRSQPLPSRARSYINSASQVTIEPHLLSDDRLKIAVTLIDRHGVRHGVLRFRYEWSGGEPSVVLEP